MAAAVKFAEPSKFVEATTTSPDVVKALAVANLVAVPAFPEVFWLPAPFTPGKFILAVPLKLTPPIVRALASAVAVAASPVQEPEDPLTSPVTSPVISPVNVEVTPVAASIPELELNVKLVPDLAPKLPVAAVENNGKQVVSDDSSATVIVVEAAAKVAAAAVPEVFWLPAVFTPGKLIFADPLNDTPPMFLAVAKVVAVSALPSKAPSNLVASISPEALNVTPSPAPTLNTIVLSVANFIWLSASLPKTKPVFNTDVIVV